MKHIKLYEDFFSFFLYDKLSERDIKLIYGLSREDIEDSLMGINDTGLYNTSINFMINNEFLNSDNYEIQKDVYFDKKYDEEGVLLKPGERGSRREIKTLLIEIHIFLTKSSLNKIGIDSSEFEEGKTDILIPDLLEFYNQFKLRFKGFEITEKHKETVKNLISFHPEEKVYYGDSIMSICMKKTPN